MTSQSIAERPGPPPLRIHHFLLCGVVSAIYLTWWKKMVPASAVQQLPPWAIGVTAVYNALAAIELTLAVLSVYWHFTGYAGLAQPGQWLLVSYLVFVVPMVMNNALLKLTGFDWPGTLQGYYGTVPWLLANLWYFILYLLLPLAFFAYCALAVSDTRPWRWVFIVAAILTLPIVAWASRILSTGFNVPMKTAIVVPTLLTAGAMLGVESWALTTDITCQRPRYWTHWAGVGLAIISELCIVIGAMLTLLGWF